MPQPQDPDSEREPATVGDGGEEVVAGTGNARVDAAMARLRALDELPVEEHAEVYHAVHEELRTSLAEAGAEDGPGSPP